MRVYIALLFISLFISTPAFSKSNVRFISTDEARQKGVLESDVTTTEGDPYVNKKAPDSAYKGAHSTQNRSYKTEDCQGDAMCEKALKRQTTRSSSSSGQVQEVKKEYVAPPPAQPKAPERYEVPPPDSKN